MKYNTGIISWLMCNTFRSYTLEKDQSALVVCAYNPT